MCDTTVLLYLGRIDQAQLLPALFEPIYVPEAVVTELAMGRFLRPDTIDARTLAWAMIVSAAEKDIEDLPPNRLGVGERAVIAYARHRLSCWAGLVSTIRPPLDVLQSQGFHMSHDLYLEALRLADEDRTWIARCEDAALHQKVVFFQGVSPVGRSPSPLSVSTAPYWITG